MDDYLQHYGTPRHSGRYPWGSGDNPYQRNRSFMENYYAMHDAGKTDTEIAEYFRNNVPGYEKFSTVDLRAKKSIASAEERAANIIRAKRLAEHGNGPTAIGKLMGVNESTVRGWLKADEQNQKDKLMNTSDQLKKAVDTKGYLDIGAGVEFEMGVTRTNLDTAAAILKDKGYNVYTLQVDQPNNPGNKTTIKVLAPPDATWADVYYNTDKIKSFKDYSPDGGVHFQITEYPSSIDSKRVFIKYAEDGGTDKDGVIEIRKGVKDLSLGDSSYAQVRIALDDKYYLKGMALYSDDIPKGYDIVLNSNKHTGTPPDKVFKQLEDNKDMPFGSLIKANGQSYYPDDKGNYVKEGDIFRKATNKDDGDRYSLSAINKLREEGDWDQWSKTLSSQFLSKQNLSLIKKQLDLTYDNKKAEYDEIMSLTNPAVKQKLLNGFAADCDSSAVDLKAASLPRQSTKVILPLTSITDKEIYAPTYKDGERVVLVRHPHGGTFEIPELVVNNKDSTARKLFGNIKDAVGINPKTASILSGADFDGDTVLVIPVNDRVKIKTSKPLEGLKNFDPKAAYPGYEGMPKMTDRTKGIEMGSISNLITDMTLRGASPSELERAVKHSMVVIDAKKHNLNYKQSFEDNAIAALKKKYQGSERSGASTLISKASAEKDVYERKYKWKPNPETGEWEYEETGRTYVQKKTLKDGTVKEKVVRARQKTTWMADTKDARTLSSGTEKEEVYADYANKLKKLANESRKQALAIKPVEADPSAKQTYKKEVTSLTNKLRTALLNAPRERQATIMANNTIRAKYAEDPTIKTDGDRKKKVKQHAMAEARAKYGASKTMVEISDREWEAIQSRAISTTYLKKILDNTDMDKLKKLATPKTSTGLTQAQQSRIKSMNASGLYSISDIADVLNISTSAVSKYI